MTDLKTEFLLEASIDLEEPQDVGATQFTSAKTNLSNSTTRRSATCSWPPRSISPRCIASRMPLCGKVKSEGCDSCQSNSSSSSAHSPLTQPFVLP